MCVIVREPAGHVVHAFTLGMLLRIKRLLAHVAVVGGGEEEGGRA